jgi:hypothetical protein
VGAQLLELAVAAQHQRLDREVGWRRQVSLRSAGAAGHEAVRLQPVEGRGEQARRLGPGPGQIVEGEDLSVEQEVVDLFFERAQARSLEHRPVLAFPSPTGGASMRSGAPSHRRIAPARTRTAGVDRLNTGDLLCTVRLV